MTNFHVPFNAENAYHIVSRAVGQETLFKEEDNYGFFLMQCQKYILPVCEIFSYCLMPNHFHFLARVKEVRQIRGHFELKKPKKAFDQDICSGFIMECFSNLLNSYCKAFNKRYNRKGSLFISPLRRVEVREDEQFWATVFYIHKNPVHHGYCEQLNQWKWSSYNAFFSRGSSSLNRKYVLDSFGGLQVFKQYHAQPVQLKKAAILE